MLVLSRKVGESIVIPGFHLVLTILERQGNRVRVGIAAPPGVQVHRREVWERIHEAESEAADSLPSNRGSVES